MKDNKKSEFKLKSNRNGSLSTSEYKGSQDTSVPKLALPRYGHGKGASIGFENFFRKKEYADIKWGNLPHWQQEGVMQFITARLSDSMPQSKLEEIKLIKEEWLKKHPGPWTGDEIEEYNRLFDLIDYWLDQGYGECILRYKVVQDIIENALLHFDGERYDLYDYIILPNHIHVLLIPGHGYELKNILKTIKGYTGKEINKYLNRKGPVWQKESWDRLIRSFNDYENKKEYIEHNGDHLGAEVSRLP